MEMLFYHHPSPALTSIIYFCLISSHSLYNSLLPYPPLIMRGKRRSTCCVPENLSSSPVFTLNTTRSCPAPEPSLPSTHPSVSLISTSCDTSTLILFAPLLSSPHFFLQDQIFLPFISVEKIKKYEMMRDKRSDRPTDRTQDESD